MNSARVMSLSVRQNERGARGEVEARVDVEEDAGEQAVCELLGDAEDVGEAEVRIGGGTAVDRQDRATSGGDLGGKGVEDGAAGPGDEGQAGVGDQEADERVAIVNPGDVEIVAAGVHDAREHAAGRRSVGYRTVVLEHALEGGVELAGLQT